MIALKIRIMHTESLSPEDASERRQETDRN